jgi:hypothetical protein
MERKADVCVVAGNAAMSGSSRRDLHPCGRRKIAEIDGNISLDTYTDLGKSPKSTATSR